MRRQKLRAGLFSLLALLIFIVVVPITAGAAVTKVICVPWQGDISKYHTTWDGKAAQLKGVIHTDSTDPIYYRWNFGDGTNTTVTLLTGATKYNVEALHTYTGSVGTPFTATLIVADNDSLAGAVEDPYLVKIEESGLDSKINMAIDIGLWSLYKAGSDGSGYYHTFDGSPFLVWSYGSYFASPTASAVHAFEINGHKETGNADEDPYVSAVEKGLNWLFNGYYYADYYPMLKALDIGITPQGHDPDMRINGKGIEVCDYGYRPVYQGGMIMDAIIASGTPDADSGRDFDGDGDNDTYAEVVQDMVDMYAAGQYDGVNATYGVLGGWRYSWNQAPDNSACQWAAIGMIPAEKPPWNTQVPDWVKEYDDNWLHYSYYDINTLWGGFGYTYPGYGDALTPSGMVQLSFVDATTSDTRWVKSERWLADNWKDVGRDWLDQNNVYAYYAFAKAMRLALPSPVVTFSSNNFDWYRGDGITLGLAEKIADHLLLYGVWDYYGPNLGTAWSVIILKPVLFAEAPVACFDADPNPSYPDMPISFDPGCSTHSEADKDISNLTLFEWDWDNDGTFDSSTTAPTLVNHSFSCASIPCTYPVTLKVTDDSIPARTATYVRNIEITNPPHPPVARAGGPYLTSMCTGDVLIIDGSDSYDPDEGTHEAGCTTCPDDTITAWDWDLDGAPFDYTSTSGETVDFGTGFPTYFGVAQSYDIGLRVTDNTEESYPGSESGDLTDEDFTMVDVKEGCICELTAVPGCQYVSLSWDDIGAETYYILMSTTGPNSGFEEVGNTTDTSKIMGSFVMGQTTWYRVVAETGNSRCMSLAKSVYADEELCTPIADPGGPYEGCAGEDLTLDGSGSTALAGTIVAWNWDLDDDGAFDDAFGENVTHSWATPGLYTIGLEVISSDSLTMDATETTTVNIIDCSQGCVDDLSARAKDSKIQLVWSYTGADHYNVYRSTTSGGPYALVGTTTSTYSTYLDYGLANGTTYYYVVREADVSGDELCQSNEASATAIARRRR